MPVYNSIAQAVKPRKTRKPRPCSAHTESQAGVGYISVFREYNEGMVDQDLVAHTRQMLYPSVAFSAQRRGY